MRPGHFEALRPVCPACRTAGAIVPLALGAVEERRGADVWSAFIGCARCGTRFPVIDGLPVLVPDPRRFVADTQFYFTLRDDLPPALAGFAAEAAGSGSAFDTVRQHLSSYGWDHWADCDPEEAPGELAAPGGVARLVAMGLDPILADLPPGPILDLGCGAGRSAAALAARTGRLVVGVDLSLPLARLARRAVVEGRVSYDRRRVGLAFDRRDFAVDAQEGADVWICDALSLPFADDTFALVVGMNILDCLPDPCAGLAEIGRVAMPEGVACLATPFDWSVAATPQPNWLGGTMVGDGQAEPALAALLSDGPAAAGPLRLSGEPAEAEWHVRLHARSAMRYRTHMVWARKGATAAQGTAAQEVPA